MTPRPPLPHFTEETARQEVQAAEDAWNSRDPERVALANATVSAPDLTQRPPRSPRVRLGGYAMLPRLLDKARASLTGKTGEYMDYLDADDHVTHGGRA